MFLLPANIPHVALDAYAHVLLAFECKSPKSCAFPVDAIVTKSYCI